MKKEYADTIIWDKQNAAPAMPQNVLNAEFEYIHIFSNKGEEEIKKLLNEYACYVEKIRKDYRNPSAHRNAIKKINAKECFELVLDVEKLLKRMLESFDN